MRVFRARIAAYTISFSWKRKTGENELKRLQCRSKRNNTTHEYRLNSELDIQIVRECSGHHTDLHSHDKNGEEMFSNFPLIERCLTENHFVPFFSNYVPLNYG